MTEPTPLTGDDLAAITARHYPAVAWDGTINADGSRRERSYCAGCATGMTSGYPTPWPCDAARLAVEVARLRNESCPYCTAVNTLDAEVTRLRKLVTEYARHQEACPGAHGPEYPCECGWRVECLPIVNAVAPGQTARPY